MERGYAHDSIARRSIIGILCTAGAALNENVHSTQRSKFSLHGQQFLLPKRSLTVRFTILLESV